MKRRNPSLDVLRALAILEVIGFHLGLPGFALLGSLGVDLFLALSGFFISGILFSDIEQYGTIRLGHFWTNRAFKILPPLYIFLAVMLLILPKQRTLPGFAHSALFCMNYFPVQGPFLHTWSLALEEQFYLFLPVLLLILIWLFKRIGGIGGNFRYRSLNTIPWVFLAIMVATFILRIPNPDGAVFHLRADGLFVGVFVRYLSSYKPLWFQAIAKQSFIPGVLLWIPAVMLSISHSSLMHSVLYVGIDAGCGCLLAWCYLNDHRAFWHLTPFKVLASIGIYSYSIYLWQQPVITIFRNGLGGSPIMLMTGCIVSLLVGWMMYNLVEVPALRVRKWVHSRQAIPACKAEGVCACKEFNCR